MKKFLLHIILTSTFLIFTSFSFAQNKNIDSLLSLIKTDKSDTGKVIHLLKLAEVYSYQNPDSAIYFAEQAKNIAEKINDKKLLANALGELGWDNNVLGDHHKALDYYTKALKIDEELKNKKGIATHLSHIGSLYIGQADYPKALDYYFRALKIAEEFGYKNNIASVLGNIGIVYYYQAEYSKALDYYFNALKMNEELGDKNGIESVLGNIGIIYAEQADYPKALDYHFKALKMAEELGNKNSIASWLGNLGNVYNAQGDYPKALEFYLKALEMDEKIGEKNRIAVDLAGIGSLYTKIGKFKEAEKFITEAIGIDESIGALNELRQFEENLSKLYDTTGQQKLALIHYKKAMVLKDTIFSHENKKQLVRKEMNFEFEKKVAVTKAENENQKSIAEEKSRKQKIITWAIAGGLLLVLVFAGFVFRSLRITRQQKQIIEIKNTETEHQKKIIEEKNKDITDSINYASRIQQAMLTSEEYISKHLPADYFIYYQPKDIVSGDFYWAFEKMSPSLNGESQGPKSFFLATSDCTGHGVPGAFMSLLNISFLNENVIERNITEPNKILNEQRKEIIKALNPKGTENSKDGMDCVLCRFDFYPSSSNGEAVGVSLTFAAANNPLWVIRNISPLSPGPSAPEFIPIKKGENALRPDLQFTEYFPDKMPVGKYSEDDNEFTQQTIQLKKGDIVYTFTDGYADQFGGPKGKKFKHKQLENLLLAHCQLPMEEQKKILEQTFSEWKGNLDQVDDVCVIGVRI